MRRMDVAVAGTKWCSGIRTEKLANSLRGDHLVFSQKDGHAGSRRSGSVW